MALADKPAAANNIAAFGDAGASPARLRYDVALPGQLRNRRVISLEGLGLSDGDWRITAFGDEVVKEIGLQQTGGAGTRFSFDNETAIGYFVRQTRATGVPGDKLAELERFLNVGAGGAARLRGASVASELGGGPGGQVGLTPSGDPPVPELLPILESYLDKLTRGRLEITRPDGSGGIITAEVPVETKPQPQLALVEVYAVSSLLGDYGLGRTVKTMTLLPGEELTLRFRTWRSSEESIKDSSSVFDSATKESKERFNKSVLDETTDKRTKSKEEEWHAEAEASGSWGFGSASVSGGGSGQYHSGREQFARQVNDASKEHARESSNKRETNVTSSTERTQKVEEEETTERVIRNVNMRRTLNFVFRELNQSFETYTHLLEVKVAYTDGTPNSWREVPLSGMRGLLQEVLQKKVEKTAQAILGLINVVFDEQDQPQKVIERFHWDAANDKWTGPEDPKRDGAGKKFKPPSRDIVYRYKRGKIGKDAKGNEYPVEGVVMRRDTVTLRTDSVLVEALLGQADALDEYAMVSQKADAEAKSLANERARTVNEALAGLSAAKRAEAYAEILNGDGVVRLDLHQLP